MQQLMRQFSIRTRMLGAIAVVLVLLATVGSAGLWGMWRLHGLSESLIDHAFAETVKLSTLRGAIGDMARYERDMIIAYEQPEPVRAALAKWKAARDVAKQQIAALTEGEDDADNVLLRQMDAQLQTYASKVEPVAVQLETGGYDSAPVVNRVLTYAHQEFANLTANLEKVSTLLTEEAQGVARANEDASRLTLMVFGVALALAVLVVVPTTLANMSSICRPVEEARELAGAITAGDLTRTVRADGQDELSALLRDLGTMQASLARIVGEVRNSTDSIGTASSQIASGNQDLSSRTEQTASSLQQTAASVEQISGNVRQTADVARQASEMAVAAARVAARGGEVVGQVVSTMDDIHRSSQKISDIIGVIDGIAFQTNILALNAAVEAARAGEQGRGFAVVAGEVRNLAQRSAEAAKEIKSLIGASVDKVEAGSKLVAEAGQTIGEIVTNADRVSAFIGDITTAAQDQSGGIGQVNTAVARLDEMTQQNAALVEESAAAAESLREQAQRLSDVVRVFRLTTA